MFSVLEQTLTIRIIFVFLWQQKGITFAQRIGKSQSVWKTSESRRQFILIVHNYLLLGAVHKKLGACAGQQPPSESAGSEELLQCTTGKTSSRAKLISISQAAYTHRPEQQNYKKSLRCLKSVCIFTEITVSACMPLCDLHLKVKVTEIQTCPRLFVVASMVWI